MKDRHDEPTRPVRIGPTPQEAARYFYEKFWQNAPRYGIKTFGDSPPADWTDVPRSNRELLVDTFRSVLLWMRTGRR